MRWILVGLALLAGCNSFGSAPITFVGGDGAPDGGVSSTFGGGTPDAGNRDGGSFDGFLDGGNDAGTTDAGLDAGSAETLDCAPFGVARLAWTLQGYQNPWNNYDARSYLPIANDTLDGIRVSQITLSGHFASSTDATYGPDGDLRVNSVDHWSCHPLQGCSSSYAAISNGTIYSSVGSALSAKDGHLIYSFDPAPAGADAGAYWVQEGVATNGQITAFTWSNYQAPTSTVTALHNDGGTVWQRTLPKAIEAAAVDETGITLLRMSYAADLVAFAPDGGQLYSQTPDVNLGLQAAGGRFTLGGRTLYSVADGSQLLTLPVAPAESPLLTATRAYVWTRDSSTGRSEMVAVDAATGSKVWERPLQKTTSAHFAFGVTAERAVLIDPQGVLHVLRDDGTDLVACKVGPDVRSPVLFLGGRLALQRYPTLEVYDLPY